MFTRACLSLALLLAMPAWSQAGMNSGDQMATPSPVSGQTYSTAFDSETRSNYLRAGVIVSPAYSDNVFPDVGAHPISDISYSIYPTIAIDQTRSRLHWSLAYDPGFTLYQRTTSYDQTDQSVLLNFTFRLSPHITLNLSDSLLKASSVFNQPDSLSEGAVSGATPTITTGVIAPVADELTNSANVVLSYQFSKNAMIGAGGAFTNLDFLNPTQAGGLADSSSSQGSAFYTYRLSKNQDVGVTCPYSRILAYPLNARSDLQTESALGFYTVHLNPTLSFSFSGGVQHFELSQPSLPAYSAWSPSLVGSLGWQGSHTNIAVSYSRVVTGGGGLVGAFQSNSANAYTRWQLARTWGVGVSGSYASNKDVTPSTLLSTEGGHSIFGTVSTQHHLSEHFQVEFGYTRLHQSYSGIPLISNAPNTNREYISISYQFERPLGG